MPARSTAGPGAAAGADASGTTEMLRQVKLAEQDSEHRIAEARRASEERIRQLRDDSEASVRAARTSEDAERSRRVAEATDRADLEARAIEEEGARSAGSLSTARPTFTSGQRQVLLDLILGDLE